MPRKKPPVLPGAIRRIRIAAATEMKPLAPGSTFEARQHWLARADFERSAGALYYYLGYSQTCPETLARIDVTAESPEQLKTIADTLQSLTFDETE